MGGRMIGKKKEVKEKEKLGKGGRKAKKERRKVESKEERKESPVGGGQRRHLRPRGVPRGRCLKV